MRKSTKIIASLACAALLVVGSVMGTMAYLTSQTEVVNNTFTAGKLAITLDEADVDVYGKKETEDRVPANEYKLIPGHEYVKDPTVHFQPNSEEAYLFVKVDMHPGMRFVLNDKHLDGNIGIDDQIRANGWQNFKMVPGTQGDNYTAKIYCQKVSANFTDKAVDYQVFDHFVTSTTEQATKAMTDVANAGAKIQITAYAVQADGFKTAEEAWNATFGK